MKTIIYPICLIVRRSRLWVMSLWLESRLTTHSSTQLATAHEAPKLYPPTQQLELGKEIKRIGQKKNTPLAQSGRPNHFLEVHGLFFYPLMKGYDNTDNTFNLLGEDSIVLSKLLHTLSVFVRCVGNAATPSALFRMVRSLVDLVWAVRYHREANVRRAALLTIAQTIVIVPTRLLISDFLEDFNEVQAWLVSVFDDDPDEQCRTLASTSLLDLRKVAESIMRHQLSTPTHFLTTT